MRLLLGLLMALFMASVAAATSGSLWDDGMPPSRYQGDITLLVHYVHRPIPQKPCDVVVPQNMQLNACAVVVAGHPENYLPNPCSAEFAGQSFARYACHELAHSHGWPADHPR